MPLFPGPGLAEAIVLELHQGPLETETLLKRLYARGQQATKQGIYKALRALRANEIVFLNQGEASLSVRWLERLERFVTLTQHSYFDPLSQAGHFLNLADGERVTYTFKNPTSADAFWNHALYILFEANPTVRAWYAYAPHCWYMLARKKEEQALYRFINKHGARVLYTVGNTTALDRSIAKAFDGDKTQYHLRSTPLAPGRSERLGVVVNVVGDFVIEAEYESSIVDQIETFYRTHKMINQEQIKELEAIVTTPAKVKLTIRRNQKRAQKLARSLTKPFYVGRR